YYLNYKNTPIYEFCHILFSDWDDKEWSRFDNYMINCEQYYLENGLVESEYQNLEARKFIKETSFEFYQWVTEEENLPTGIRLYKTDKYESFLKENPDLKKWLTQSRFA